ncbi:MAG: hypothetical protein GF308_11565 [Candidatus Heimdallarchaeota archaeon]|nr:hypothetical protein [Candidatus Heimdallarchaeota archaeon]
MKKKQLRAIKVTLLIIHFSLLLVFSPKQGSTIPPLKPSEGKRSAPQSLSLSSPSKIELKNNYPILELVPGEENTIPAYCGPQIRFKVSAITDVTNISDAITLTASINDLEPRYTEVGPYFIHQEIAFGTSGFNGNNTIYVKATDYKNRESVLERTTIIDRENPILDLEVNNSRIYWKWNIVVTWKVQDTYFERIVFYLDGKFYEEHFTSEDTIQIIANKLIDERFEASKNIRLLARAYDKAGNYDEEQYDIEIYIPDDELPYYPKGILEVIRRTLEAEWLKNIVVGIPIAGVIFTIGLASISIIAIIAKKKIGSGWFMDQRTFFSFLRFGRKNKGDD